MNLYVALGAVGGWNIQMRIFPYVQSARRLKMEHHLVRPNLAFVVPIPKEKEFIIIETDDGKKLFIGPDGKLIEEEGDE